MKMMSRMFLIVSGVFMLMTVVATIFVLAVTWGIFGINLIFNIVLSIMIETGGSADVINGMLMFTSFVSPVKFMLNFLFGMGEAELAGDMIVTYLVLESVIEFISAVIETIASGILLIVGILGMIFAFIGASNKPKPGIHIMNIALGGLCYLYVNQFVGIFMLLGGIFGTISDKRAKREEEQKQEVSQLELQPAEL